MLRPFAWNHNVVADVRVLAAQAPYTEGTPQRLDSDVHSVVTAKKSTALWQRKRAQHYVSDGADSNVTALTAVVVTVLR